jgi:hypothetical protein
MTALPKRLVILQRLQATIETATPGQSIDTYDLTSGKVFRGRMIFGEEIKPLPAISIIEAPQTDPNTAFAGDASQGRNEYWNLFVQGIVDDDKLNPCDEAYKLCAAVEQRLSRITAVDSGSGNAVYPQDYLLGGLIHDLRILPPVVRPPEKTVSSSAFFFLPLRVGVSVPVSDPYTTG